MRWALLLIASSAKIHLTSLSHNHKAHFQVPDDDKTTPVDTDDDELALETRAPPTPSPTPSQGVDNGKPISSLNQHARNPVASPTPFQLSDDDEATASPTTYPTPTIHPTQVPTQLLTSPCSGHAVLFAPPTMRPTAAAYDDDDLKKTSAPTLAPTPPPTCNPTHAPTSSPTKSPTHAKTHKPTKMPTPSPTAPTASPTVSPTTKHCSVAFVHKLIHKVCSKFSPPQLLSKACVNKCERALENYIRDCPVHWRHSYLKYVRYKHCSAGDCKVWL
jgi:hypothetical protein